ncbi:HU family DNA-binding protein [Oscillatoria acuminata]|uniref:Bacterial nucleoid DNA-binding protein n=1 Tax=Oscillatoria acuminata PCC 6304 TaxID=56110 RepID=K9TJL5_9CYAN|nr:HU family DNA-binding protein [Oscillatoria acuminata]AFY83047.1 bacterial nucleoid DNA-binding protein [Oscillatoria acuminata PCC 6304]
MSIDKTELIAKIAQRVQKQPEAVEEILDATLVEIYESLKQGQSVSLKNFGTFYIRPEGETSVFKFNPSQRLRKLFGWASTYRGEL